MTDRNYDEGMTHNHHWATEPSAQDRARFPRVADAALLPTPSSVLHDDLMEISR